jgi:hypothetical protein
MSLSNITLQKQPGESRLLSMPFDNKMVSGEIITAINSVTQTLADGGATSDLTFSGQVFAGQIAQMLIAGGTIPNRDDIQFCDYKVTVTITTDLGQILENDGILKVKED